MWAFALLLFCLKVIAHPHHHSVAIFDYNDQTNQLELSLKILIEDFEKIQAIEKPSFYLAKHLKIEINSNSLKAEFQGSEEDHEFMWFYYTFDVALSPGNNSVEVTNTLLKSFNNNQFNTVKFSLFKKSQTHNFLFTENQYNFIFK